jgi:hypothetical protein
MIEYRALATGPQPTSNGRAKAPDQEPPSPNGVGRLELLLLPCAERASLTGCAPMAVPTRCQLWVRGGDTGKGTASGLETQGRLLSAPRGLSAGRGRTYACARACSRGCACVVVALCADVCVCGCTCVCAHVCPCACPAAERQGESPRGVSRRLQVPPPVRPAGSTSTLSSQRCAISIARPVGRE